MSENGANNALLPANSERRVNVDIDTSGLQPKASRAVGNVGIVGDAGGHGSASANVPVLISSVADANKYLATTNSAGAVTGSGSLYKAVKTALLQDPAPSRVYAVATSGGDYASGLAVLAPVDVQFVCLAGETDVGVAGPPATNLLALKDHVESVSSDGKARVGVAMVDPELTVAADSTFAATAESTYASLKSSVSRMILVAARVGATGGGPDYDVAAAGAGVIAGYNVHITALMKPVGQLSISVEKQFSPSEIKELSEVNINPIFDPALVPGEGLYLGAGRTYTTDTSKLYIDIVRVLDDIDFRLKAGMIGSIGNVRIDRLGMQTLENAIASVLSPLKRRRVITNYSIYIPLLDILAKEEAARSADESTELTNSRVDRRVEVFLSITYGPQVHVLVLSVALKA